MVEETSTARKRSNWLERVRHVAWAGLIALGLLFLTALDPIDQVTWMAQSRIASEPASGDIVFIGADTDLADPDLPRGRRQLADLVTRLDGAGADRVYVDIVFDRASDPDADRDLNAAMRRFSGEAYFVRDVETDYNGRTVLRENRPEVASGVPEVANFTWLNYLGYAWHMPFSVSDGETALPNLPAHVARATGGAEDNFAVSYVYDLESIPTHRVVEVMRDGENLDEFAGKTVIIGPSADLSSRPPNIPGHKAVPGSIVSIYAAETLLDGAPLYIGGLLPLIGLLGALLLACSLRQPFLRRAGYGVLTTSAVVFAAFAPQLGLRVNMAYALAIFAGYAFFRLRAQWRRNLMLVDPATSLPTFAALESDEETAENVPAIIVARIHRFEEVRRTLPVDLHAEYVLAITGRLKAATQDATIYLGQGHMIAWTMTEKDPALLREHLEGLRALFGSPLVVGTEQVDVGITFGIDITPSPNVARRLASAIAVAEKTNETFEPIAIADTASQEDLIWNISLQARIDAALTNGEIYLAFQPKIMVQTGEIVGAEVLVRWNDPVKGHIPPDYFIRQCETAGRMSQLTRFVLEEACKAGNAFAAEGLNLPIAVNISATLLHERSIVTMVREVLDKTGFEPSRLTLEITETYRISNLDLAAEILGELRALGTKISMDDFGVGAASLEALLRLPFSELKIDRMFIAPMTSDPKALGIVKSVLQLGRDLRIIVVAEGVEDAGTLTLLRDSGCIVAQGFAISRPVKFDRILEYHRYKEKVSIQNMV